MIQHHSSTAQQRAQWVSILLAQQGTYGTVSELSQQAEVSRQTFYSWKAKGQRALQATFKRVHVIFLHGDIASKDGTQRDGEWPQGQWGKKRQRRVLCREENQEGMVA